MTCEVAFTIHFTRPSGVNLPSYIMAYNKVRGEYEHVVRAYVCHSWGDLYTSWYDPQIDDMLIQKPQRWQITGDGVLDVQLDKHYNTTTELVNLLNEMMP